VYILYFTVVFSLKISQANQELNSSLANAKATGEMAKTARIHSLNILNESYSLIERHQTFLNPTGVQSVDVAMKIDEVIIIILFLQRLDHRMYTIINNR
jgi:hypothetical protein